MFTKLMRAGAVALPDLAKLAAAGVLQRDQFGATLWFLV